MFLFEQLSEQWPNVVKQLYLRKINYIKINYKYDFLKHDFFKHDFLKHNCLICKVILGENYHKKNYGNFCSSCHYASREIEEYQYNIYY
jgi:hypothetical protein